jgi:hypothetical protein
MRGLTPCRLLVVLLPGDRARAECAGEEVTTVVLRGAERNEKPLQGVADRR